MTHAVETMAYAREVPWHGLGKKVKDNMSPQQMLKEAGIDWTVSKRPVFIEKGKKHVEIKDRFALCRDTDDAFLSMVGTTYKPVQNEEAFEFFKKFVKAGHMTMDTAGSLWGGRYIWGLAKLGSNFKLGKDDQVTGNLLIMQPHIRGRAMIIQTTAIRVVCWNTLQMALGTNLKGESQGGSFRMPHSMRFDDSVKQQAELALGLAKGQMEEFHQAATLLAKKRAKEDAVEEFFCQVLKFDPKKAAKKKKGGEIKEPRMLPKFQQALLQAPGQNLNSAKGTWWGALNAVTYVLDHEAGRDRSTALRNAWVGNNARMKRRALDLAIKHAK